MGHDLAELNETRRRFEWALFLAGHSAYEVELVELAFGDPARRKFSTDAIEKLKSTLMATISDFDDLRGEVGRLKHLRDELAHGGGILRLKSQHVTAVEEYVERARLMKRKQEEDTIVLEFPEGVFTSFVEEMNQIVVVSRADGAAQA